MTHEERLLIKQVPILQDRLQRQNLPVFYNQRRRHSTLGQISSAEFERRAAHAA
jgi:transposase InsO family protein